MTVYGNIHTRITQFYEQEHIRTAPPVKHSLEKMIPGPLWEKGFTGDIHKWGDPILPENWLIRTHKGADMPRKTGAYQKCQKQIRRKD